jgi:hypothetical protein
MKRLARTLNRGKGRGGSGNRSGKSKNLGKRDGTGRRAKMGTCRRKS